MTAGGGKWRTGGEGAWAEGAGTVRSGRVQATREEEGDGQAEGGEEPAPSAAAAGA